MRNYFFILILCISGCLHIDEPHHHHKDFGYHSNVMLLDYHEHNYSCEYTQPYLHMPEYCDFYDHDSGGNCCVWDVDWGCYEEWCSWDYGHSCEWEYNGSFCQ